MLPGRLAIFIIFSLILAVSPAYATGLTIGSGCQLALNDGALNVDGDVVITGAMSVGSGSINLTGDWSNGGTFNPGTGTVTFNGTNQSISGSTTFYNLTKNVTIAATLLFQSGSTNKTTITNTLNLKGANEQLLSLTTDSADQWEIDPLPGGTRTIQYLDVQKSKNVNDTRIDAVGKNCTDSGDNTGWNFDGVPTVTTQAVTGIGTNSATGNGNITDLGNPNPTAHGVCWNTTGTPTISDNKDDKGAATATGDFTANITGLTSGTAYHVRAYATNSNGTTYGSDMTFTTSSATAPTVTTTDVSSIATTTASSGGDVTSEGGSSVTVRGICWSTSADPITEDDHTSDGTGTGTFTSTLTDLTPNTIYYVRAYATNSGGTSYGSSKSFSTLPPISPGTYYLDIQNGSDSNDGSSGSPWKTLHHAIDQINGGSAGSAENGYLLYVLLGAEYSNANGEANRELSISQSYVKIFGEKGSGPIINGANAANWADGIKITGSHIHLKNLFFTGFTGANGTGINIVAGSNNVITRCRVYGNYDGISVWQSDNCTIQNSEIDNNNFDGIIVQACSPEISRNKIYDNRFNISVQAYGSEVTSPTIKNNLIYEVTSGEVDFGILIGSNDSSTVAPKIHHNTIDKGTYEGIIVEKYGTSTISPEIKYNIITNFQQYGIQNSSGTPTINYNDVWNNGNSAADNYKDCTGGANDISLDPKYASYSLQSTSPCINKIPSTEGDPVTLDYPGFKRPRPGKSTKDMGAYEYVADVTNNYALPGGTGIARDYRMFTVPLNLGTGADMVTAMENVLGSYDPTHWRAFLYTGTLYREFNSSQFASQAIVPGMGFWIITTYTNQIPFEGEPAPDGVDYVMDLEPGWHLIGLPWISTQISLGNIKVTDGVYTYAITSTGNNLTQKFMWDFTGDGPDNGYVKQNSPGFLLQHNTGYFFKVASSTPVRLIIPTSDAQGATTSDLKTIPFNETNTHEDDELPPPPPGWPQPELFDCPAISNGRLENITFPSDADCQKYIYQGTLTIGSGVIMEDGAKVTIKATRVNIESSFRAENGAVVKIITQP